MSPQLARGGGASSEKTCPLPTLDRLCGRGARAVSVSAAPARAHDMQSECWEL